MKITNTLQTKITSLQKQIVWQDFGVILGGGAVLALFVAFGEGIPLFRPVRVLMGLTYVFLVPGYCLTTALFPRINDLAPVERLSLSIGFSIASVSVLALVLEWLHWGLYPLPILLSELGISGLLMTVTLWRRAQLSPEAIYLPAIVRQSPWSFPAFSKRRFLFILSAGLIISILGTLAVAAPTSNEFMTEFYILGSEGLIADYPYQVAPGDEVRVHVGVINQEKSELTYRIEVWVTDSRGPGKRERVMQPDSFLLPPGEKSERTISWYMPWVGVDQRVDLLLFKNQQTEPSRQLRMWINVKD